MGVADLRRDYRSTGVSERDLDPDPFIQFARWFAEAVEVHDALGGQAAGVDEVNAMTLATADHRGIPSARTVLLKGYDATGFTWFTNYESRKGEELAANPRAALVIRWSALARQVCMRGVVSKVSLAESDEYFYSRPLGSRIGAAASAQSKVLAGGRAELDAAAAALVATYPDGNVPRPPHWGGYRLAPLVCELWQGRDDRLHDRFRYERASLGASIWVLDRLAP